jgi:PadR family transcriptional regulator PadR
MSPTPPSRPEAPGPAAELVVLSVLAEGPLYGYAIAKEAASRSGGEFKLSPGVLYPLLKSLERDALITSTWETVRSERSAPEPESSDAEDGTEAAGGRRRKWYRLSAKGRKRLAQRVAAHRAYLAMIENFLRGRGGEGRPEESAP